MSAAQFQNTLQKPYDRQLFATDVLNRIFGSRFTYQQAQLTREDITETERKVIQSATVYGSIKLDDGTTVTCYEILLTPSVRIEQSRVAIQRYVRKLLIAGDMALVSFVSPTDKNTWRLTFIAKDSVFTEGGIKETATHVKRYTYLLGTTETCKTAAERLESLQNARNQDTKALTDTFSVEKLSKAFFDEYEIHYKKFRDYLLNTPFRQSAFNGNEKSIQDFSKKLLGRLVFLYFVQKKGWLGASDTQYKDGNTQFIKSLFLESGGGETFYYNWLSVLFFDTLNAKRSDDVFKMPDGSSVKIPYLNGGLFDKEKHDDAVLTFNSTLFHNPLNPDDPKTRGFLDFLDAFNFTVFEDSPDEQTMAVDPEMLGHIFEHLLEDRKDKGAFYTPKEIVHYMCQESLIEYLTTHLSKEFTVYLPFGKAQVELFSNETRQGQLKMIEEIGDKALNRDDVTRIVKQKDIAQLTRQQLTRINELLDTVKICDPAIGSGAFPMGLLHEIFAIKEVIAYETSATWLPADVKKNIIQNSIYGVDIERGAVDIARLRFWLSLVVDEDKPQPLPNLDYKIVVGNSLVSKFEDEVIDIDWDIKDGTQGNLFGSDNDENKKTLLKNISKKQRDYFNAESIDKKRFALDIRNLKIDLLINQLELMIKTQGLETYDKKSKNAKVLHDKWLNTEGWKQNIQKLKTLKTQAEKPLNHFDWKLNFPEILNPFFGNNTEGFDIVIGNPPYVQLQKLKEDSAQLQKLQYKTFERTGDIYCVFYEKGVKLLKKGGVLAYITSNSWMRADYGKSLRKFFTDETNPILIIDFGGIQVFPSATVDTNILLIKNGTFQGNVYACRLQSDYKIDSTPLPYYFDVNKLRYTPTNENAWIVSDNAKLNILNQIKEYGTPLGQWAINIYRGILTGFNESFIIDSEVKDSLTAQNFANSEIIRPILKGRDIKRWSVEFSDCWLVDTCNGFTESIENAKKFIIEEEDGSFQYKLTESGEWKKAKRIEHVRGKQYRINRVIVQSDYPTVYDYLQNNESILRKREDKGEHWTNLRNCAYYEDFSKPKILWADIMRISKSNISDFPRFAYDESGFYPEATAFIMMGANIKYLLASLNSKLFALVFKEFYAGTMFDDSGVRYKKAFLNNLPIKILPQESYLPFEMLVDFILFQKATPSVSAYIGQYFEQVIDGLVCELYFSEEMLSKGLNILDLVAADLAGLPDFAPLSIEAKQGQIETLYRQWTAPASEIKNRLALMAVRSPDVLGVILDGK